MIEGGRETEREKERESGGGGRADSLQAPNGKRLVYAIVLFEFIE